MLKGEKRVEHVSARIAADFGPESSGIVDLGEVEGIEQSMREAFSAVDPDAAPIKWMEAVYQEFSKASDASKVQIVQRALESYEGGSQVEASHGKRALMAIEEVEKSARLRREYDNKRSVADLLKWQWGDREGAQIGEVPIPEAEDKIARLLEPLGDEADEIRKAQAELEKGEEVDYVKRWLAQELEAVLERKAAAGETVKEYAIDLDEHARKFIALLPVAGRELDPTIQELSSPLLLEINRQNYLQSVPLNVKLSNLAELEDHPHFPLESLMERINGASDDKEKETVLADEFDRREKMALFQEELIARELLKRGQERDELYPVSRLAPHHFGNGLTSPSARHERVMLALTMDGFADSLTSVRKVQEFIKREQREEYELEYKNGSRVELAGAFGYRGRDKSWTSEYDMVRGFAELLAREQNTPALEALAEHLTRFGEYSAKKYVLAPLLARAEAEIPEKSREIYSQAQRGLSALAEMTYEAPAASVNDALTQIPDDLLSHVPQSHVVETILKLQYYHEVELYDHVDPEVHLAYAEKIQSLATSLDHSEKQGDSIGFFYLWYSTRVLLGLADKSTTDESLQDRIADRLVAIARGRPGPGGTSSVIQDVRNSETLAPRMPEIGDRVLSENRAAFERELVADRPDVAMIWKVLQVEDQVVENNSAIDVAPRDELWSAARGALAEGYQSDRRAWVASIVENYAEPVLSAIENAVKQVGEGEKLDLRPLLAFGGSVVDAVWTIYNGPPYPRRSDNRPGVFGESLYEVLSTVERASAMSAEEGDREAVRLAALGTITSSLEFSSKVPRVSGEGTTRDAEGLLYEPSNSQVMIKSALELIEGQQDEEMSAGQQSYLVGQGIGLLFHAQSLLPQSHPAREDLSVGAESARQKLIEGDSLEAHRELAEALREASSKIEDNPTIEGVAEVKPIIEQILPTIKDRMNSSDLTHEAIERFLNDPTVESRENARTAWDDLKAHRIQISTEFADRGPSMVLTVEDERRIEVIDKLLSDNFSGSEVTSAFERTREGRRPDLPVVTEEMVHFSRSGGWGQTRSSNPERSSGFSLLELVDFQGVDKDHPIELTEDEKFQRNGTVTLKFGQVAPGHELEAAVRLAAHRAQSQKYNIVFKFNGVVMLAPATGSRTDVVTAMLEHYERKTGEDPSTAVQEHPQTMINRQIDRLDDMDLSETGPPVEWLRRLVRVAAPHVEKEALGEDIPIVAAELDGERILQHFRAAGYQPATNDSTVEYDKSTPEALQRYIIEQSLVFIEQNLVPETIEFEVYVDQFNEMIGD